MTYGGVFFWSALCIAVKQLGPNAEGLSWNPKKEISW